MAAAEQLRNCISYRCCPTSTDGAGAVTWWNKSLQGTVCKKTDGRYGATDADMADHDALVD